jgi:phosphopantothenoylcysteine decarboxylase/phosphopantothenate--cysteine ligase
MGYALATEAVARGHQVVLISGPVELAHPTGCEVHFVQTTEEMRLACEQAFAACDGVIAAAAVCDYKPSQRVAGKMSKTGEPLTIELIETDDVLAGLGRKKNGRWIVGFALEATNSRENALQKLRAKNCDVVVLNGPSAIGSPTNSVELIDDSGHPIESWNGSKETVASELLGWIERRWAN